MFGRGVAIECWRVGEVLSHEEWLLRKRLHVEVEIGWHGGAACWFQDAIELGIAAGSPEIDRLYLWFGHPDWIRWPWRIIFDAVAVCGGKGDRFVASPLRA